MNREKWKEDAFFCAAAIIRKTEGPFLAEHILPQVVAKIGPPEEPRNFGPVMRWLVTEGYIKHAGFAKAKTSNGSPKYRWERT